MLLGCIVTDIAQVGPAGRLPVDYLEVKGDMLCTDPAGLRALGAALAAAGKPAAAMTSPLPRRFGCRVTGAGADHDAALRVFRDLCDRGRVLGVRTVVLGSGQARSVPAGFPPERAREQFAAFVTAAAAACAERGMALTLEPLASIETNFVNSCAQAREVVDELAGTGVAIAVDCYHVVTEGLDVAAEVSAAAGAIGHAHTSSFPRGSMDFQAGIQATFVASLRAAGYDGGLTIEEIFTDFGRQAPAAVAVLRSVLPAA